MLYKFGDPIIYKNKYEGIVLWGHEKTGTYEIELIDKTGRGICIKCFQADILPNVKLQYTKCIS